MRIGELVQKTGMAASRIRFYEASGLIHAERQSNGYREYAPETVRLIELIAAAQRTGFALEEIRRLLPGSPAGVWKHDTLLAGLRAKLAEIDALQKRLRQNRAQLRAIIERIENKPQGLACEANAERVLASLPPADCLPDLPPNAMPRRAAVARSRRRR